MTRPAAALPRRADPSRRIGRPGHAAVAAAIVAALAAVALPPAPALAAVGTPSAASPETRVLIERARQRIERKAWPLAADDLKTVLEREPGNADAHNLMGFTLRNTGDYERSRTHYLEALRLDPAHRSAHEYLGQLYVKTGRMDEARKLLAALERLCGGKSCEEYRDLAKAIADAGK